MNHSCSPNVREFKKRYRRRAAIAAAARCWQSPIIDQHGPPRRAPLPAQPAGIIDDDTWVAWRDIAVGEEVVYDYAASETGESTHMPFSCRCGAAACRGRITGDDCLLPALREKYGSSFTSLTKAKQAAADAAAGKAATA